MSPGFPPALRAAIPVLVVGTIMIATVGVCVGFPCFSTGLRYGMWVDRCPATDLRLDVLARVHGARRNSDDGLLVVVPSGRWASSAGALGSEQSHALARGFSVGATLHSSDGDPIDGVQVGRFRSEDGAGRVATITLPEVPDDDYVLRLDVDAGFDQAQVELPLPLFAPALIHAMSDRPLYKPGQDVLLRSVVLDRRDETPIEGRPGRWQIRSPDGQLVLDERVRADDWGIADTSFPLDRRAPAGQWEVVYRSGTTEDVIHFDVRPFSLPRLTATATPAQPWFGIGDDLVLEGRATYTSGAPVANAPVEVSILAKQGRWPIPLAWEPPRTTRTQRDGTFRVSYGPVPADLMDQTELRLRIRVTESAGETVTALSPAILSPQALQIRAVTEFGDGLVGDVNNRAYLRVGTPDGAPLRNTDVVVKNPWDPLDEGSKATTDADGVVAVQLDPGDPVTVVHPAPPLRVRPFLPDPPRVIQAVDGAGNGLSLVDRRGLDARFSDIAACGQFAIGNESVEIALQLRASGTVQRVLSQSGVLAECVGSAMRRARFEAAGPRVLKITWSVPDARTPYLAWRHRASWGDEIVSTLLDDAGRRARRCLTRGQPAAGRQAMIVQWYVEAGSTRVDVTPRPGDGSGLSPAAVRCVQRALSALVLPAPAKSSSLGQSTATLQVPTSPDQQVPQATTETAYEIEVVTLGNAAEPSRGRLVLPVGSIPDVRLRATPSLATPGEEVLVEVFRGPSFGGNLPERLSLAKGSVHLAEVELDGNRARFQVPDDARGFLHVSWRGGRTVIFAREPEPLTVALSTENDAYRPGATATLTVRTAAGGDPRPAGVGLVGVDQALSQLAPLLAPDDMGRVTVRANADEPAFGVFDPRALALGQISGENAAKATLLRVARLPMDAAGDERINAHGEVRADTDTEMLTSFYRVLQATIAAVRAWERSAPTTETLDPARLVALYDEARAELRAAGTPAVDGFGRELRLTVLPPELLAQLEPQRVVSDATRLPEDLVSLSRHVREEVAP